MHASAILRKNGADMIRRVTTPRRSPSMASKRQMSRLLSLPDDVLWVILLHCEPSAIARAAQAHSLLASVSGADARAHNARARSNVFWRRKCALGVDTKRLPLLFYRALCADIQKVREAKSWAWLYQAQTRDVYKWRDAFAERVARDCALGRDSVYSKMRSAFVSYVLQHPVCRKHGLGNCDFVATTVGHQRRYINSALACDAGDFGVWVRHIVAPLGCWFAKDLCEPRDVGGLQCHASWKHADIDGNVPPCTLRYTARISQGANACLIEERSASLGWRYACYMSDRSFALVYMERNVCTRALLQDAADRVCYITFERLCVGGQVIVGARLPRSILSDTLRYGPRLAFLPQPGSGGVTVYPSGQIVIADLIIYPFHTQPDRAAKFFRVLSSCDEPRLQSYLDMIEDAVTDPATHAALPVAVDELADTLANVLPDDVLLFNTPPTCWHLAGACLSSRGLSRAACAALRASLAGVIVEPGESCAHVREWNGNAHSDALPLSGAALADKATDKASAEIPVQTTQRRPRRLYGRELLAEVRAAVECCFKTSGTCESEYGKNTEDKSAVGLLVYPNGDALLLCLTHGDGASRFDDHVETRTAPLWYRCSARCEYERFAGRLLRASGAWSIGAPIDYERLRSAKTVCDLLPRECPVIVPRPRNNGPFGEDARLMREYIASGLAGWSEDMYASALELMPDLDVNE